jgi:quinol monooxygenase YgiN/catechol 2,3-dioxygenase-like lactoylglutathione lyase family enzyme
VITTTSVQRAKPGKAKELEALMQALAEEVSANEPGCTIFQYVRDPQVPNTYLVIDQYEDQAALDFHRSTGYLKAFIPKMMACLEGPPEITQYEDVLAAPNVSRGGLATGGAAFFHIGVIVADLAQAVDRFSEVLGVRFTEPATFHIPCLQDPDPHPFDLVAAYSMTPPPYYELIQADGDGICSIENADELLYFAVWETDMAGRMKQMEKQGIGIDAAFRKDPETPPFAMITKPDLHGVRIEYVDATAEHAIDDWVWTGKYTGGTP